MAKDPQLSIGSIAKRTGMAVSAIRYYESEGLLHAVRGAGGRRLFARSSIRRVSFILISQQLGYSLEQIRQLLEKLPHGRTPNKADWQQLAQKFAQDIDQRIASLEKLKASIDGCIGCGCLSLTACKLYNPADAANKLGSGPRYLLGDSAVDIFDSDLQSRHEQ